MRWEKRKKIKMVSVSKKTEPKLGDVKETVKFAFLPVKIDKVKRVWLERYVKVYTYKKYLKKIRNLDFYLMGKEYDIFECEHWVLIEKKYYHKPFDIKASDKTLSEMVIDG